LEHFEVTPYVIVNKYDINEENTEDIEKFCNENDIILLGKVPFDPTVTKAMVHRSPVVEFDHDSPASKAILNTWKRFSSLFLERL
jgi:MinD superfamily P-loop ATPase